MNRLKRSHWGFILTLLLCSFALLPLVRNTGLPAGYDVRYHVYRAAEMQRSWEAGVYLPRWAESFYYGYGYPVFHYYASSTYYLTSSLISLLGISPLDSLRVVIGIALLGAGIGFYLFLSSRWGALGGMIGALVYVYCPYILYTEPYTRGDYPELLAFGLAPWLFWRFDRLTQPAPQYWRYALRISLASLSVAVLIITHNLMALVFFGLLVGWIFWLGITQSVPRAQGGIMLACAGLGVGLAAYFWFPVVLERHDVQLQNLIDVAELDYRNFFIPLGTLLDSTQRADAGALNGLIPRYNIGWAAVGLALVGSLSLLLRWAKQERSSQVKGTLYFAFIGLIMGFLITPHAANVWEVVTPLAYLQFPWRFLGPVAFCAAILASSISHELAKLPRKWQIIGSIGIGLAILGLAIPKLYVPQWELTTLDTSVATYQQLEVAGLQRGTTFSGEFLPQTVQVIPTANDRLLADFADGRPIDHLHYEALPEGVTARLVEQNPHYHEWQISAPQAFTVEVLIFDFAGWQAEVNGEKVPITPATPHGLITFPVPVGESTVVLRMTNTPPRQWGYTISGLALLGVIGLGWGGYCWNATIPIPPSIPQLESRDLGLIGGAIFIGFIGLLAVTFRPNVAWLESQAGEALPAQNPTDYTLREDFKLLGYDLVGGDTFSAGDRLELHLYWYAIQTPQAGYASFVHITTGGPPQAQSDHQNPGGVPTLKWTPDGYIYDSHIIFLPDAMTAGNYEIRVGLWTCAGIPEGQPCGNGLRAEAVDADGTIIGDSIPLTVITVK